MLEILSTEYWAIRKAALKALASQISSAGGVKEAAFGFGRDQERKPYGIVDGIAVIPIAGPLLKEFHYPPFATSYVAVRKLVQAALEDNEVRAILLDIDSPGGTVAGCQDLADFLYAARDKKPLFAWTDGMAASAAFWLGTAAGHFAASPSAEVGSVGVVWVHADYTKMDEKMGVTFTVLRAGEFKALGNQYEPLDEKARQVHQDTLDGMYALFAGDVARNRGVDEVKLREWGEGRVFLAGEALKLGLVDAVGSREELLARIKTEVNMDASELRSKFPGAVKEIEDAAAEKSAKALAGAEKEAKKSVVAVAGELFGEDAGKKLEAVVEAGLSAEQVKNLGLARPEQAAGSSVSEKMLAALQATDQPGVVPGGKGGNNGVGKALSMADIMKLRNGSV